MAIDFDKDLLAALGGENSVIATVGGVSVRGIFDAVHQTFDEAGLSLSSSAMPTLLCRTVDVEPVDLKNALVVVGGVSYKISDRQPDGTGQTVLVLKRA